MVSRPRLPKGPPSAQSPLAPSSELDRDSARVRYVARHPGRDIGEDGRIPIAVAAVIASLRWARRNLQRAARKVGGKGGLPPFEPLDRWVSSTLPAYFEVFEGHRDSLDRMQAELREDLARGDASANARARVLSRRVEVYDAVCDELLAFPVAREELLSDAPFSRLRACFELTHAFEKRGKHTKVEEVTAPLLAWYRSRGRREPLSIELLAEGLGTVAFVQLDTRAARGRPLDEHVDVFAKQVALQLQQRGAAPPTHDDLIDLWTWHTSSAHRVARKMWNAWRTRRAKP